MESRGTNPPESSQASSAGEPLSELPSNLVTDTGSDCASDIDEADLEGVHADLSALCRDILLIIGQLERSSVSEPVGVAIREQLQNDYNRKVSNNVYNRLTDLADRGLIQKTQYIAQKKRYVLTETGWAVLEAYATQVVNDLAMFADGV